MVCLLQEINCINMCPGYYEDLGIMGFGMAIGIIFVSSALFHSKFHEGHLSIYAKTELFNVKMKLLPRALARPGL